MSPPFSLYISTALYIGIFKATAKAKIPPVDVPQIKSNLSDNRQLNFFSSLSNTTAEYKPLMPPPSIHNILNGFLSSIFISSILFN